MIVGAPHEAFLGAETGYGHLAYGGGLGMFLGSRITEVTLGEVDRVTPYRSLGDWDLVLAEVVGNATRRP